MTADRSPSGSRKPADFHDQARAGAIAALAEALNDGCVPGSEDIGIDMAEDAIQWLDAHPEAKAALAAWLVPDERRQQAISALANLATDLVRDRRGIPYDVISRIDAIHDALGESTQPIPVPEGAEK